MDGGAPHVGRESTGQEQFTEGDPVFPLGHADLDVGVLAYRPLDCGKWGSGREVTQAQIWVLSGVSPPSEESSFPFHLKENGHRLGVWVTTLGAEFWD